jgi:penicillin amidase
VKGEQDRDIELQFSDEGPIVWRTGNSAFALRSVWNEPGTAAYLGSLAYMNAASHSDFADALQHWSVPPVNQIVASIDGHIAHYIAAKVPNRTAHSGLLPVAGDGPHDWSGFHSPKDLPRIIDPECGYVASANELNPVFKEQIAEMHLGFEFHEPSRARRIRDFLASDRQATLSASSELQMDTFSYPAKRIQQLTAGDESVAKRLVANWDCRLDFDSASAALFEVWWEHHLKPSIIAQAVAGAGFEPSLAVHIGSGDNESCILHLENMDTAECRALLDQTLAQAFAECVRRLGEDPNCWRWGELHRSGFTHPLSGLDKAFEEISRIPSYPIGGSGSTVCCSAYDNLSFVAAEGASFRMVLDVGGWDNSVYINAPGQAGDPRSPSYCDHVREWAAGQYRPLLFSTEAIDQSADLVIDLVPGR